MSKLLIAMIMEVCSSTHYTSIQKLECVSVFANCIADYENKDTSFKECNKKWLKVEKDIK